MSALVISPELAEKIRGMSKARRYQAIRIANGLCAACGKEKLVSAGLGAKCLRKQRERMRKRTGAKRRWRAASSYNLKSADNKSKSRQLGRST